MSDLEALVESGFVRVEMKTCRHVGLSGNFWQNLLQVLKQTDGMCVCVLVWSPASYMAVYCSCAVSVMIVGGSSSGDSS